MPALRRSQRTAQPKAVARDVQEREYRTLRLAVADAEGFRLILATYDDPRRRDELIDRLSADGQADRVLVSRLDLSRAAERAPLLRRLREHLNATRVPEGWHHAVMVINLEALLDYREAGAEDHGLSVLHEANLHRDAFPAACPVPVVLWLSPVATTALARAAPDFWHWRVATFDFTLGPGRRMGVLEGLLSSREHRSDDVPRDVLERRVALLHELLLEIDREGDDSLGRWARKAHLLGELAWTHILLDRPNDALSCAEHQLAIAREIGDRQGEGSALNNVGSAYAALGEPRRAIELYEQALAAAREVGDRRGESNALGNLGLAYADLGEPRRAIELYEQDLAAARAVGDRRGEGQTLNNLGNAYADLSEPQRAIELYEQALAIARETGDRRGEARALFNSGLALDALGDRAQAIVRLRAALEIEEQIEDPTIGETRAKLAKWEAEAHG